MAEPRRIFISHNSAHNAESRVFLDELIDALRMEKDEAGNRIFEVLVDRDLTAGQPWRGPLYTWMLLCHAAVLLIDKNTPDTTWVPREAMIFRWRKELDKSFDLLPVLRGVGKSILSESPFKEMGLEDLGFIAEDGTAPIVNALKKDVAEWSDLRLEELENLLKLDETAGYEKAKRILALGDEWSFLKAFQPHRAIAATLLGLGFREGPFRPDEDAVDHPSAHALKSLSHLLIEGRMTRIRELLASYFVAREIGAELHDAVRRSRHDAVHGSKVIAMKLNLATLTDWPQRFVNAHFAEAFSQDIGYEPSVFRLCPLLPTNGMDDSLPAIQTAIYSTLWQTMSEAGARWSKDDETRIRDIGKTKSGRPRVFLWVLEADAIKVDDLVKVKQTMPNLGLIYLWSSDYPEHDGVLCLDTNLAKQAEEIALSETDRANFILNRRRDGIQ